LRSLKISFELPGSHRHSGFQTVKQKLGINHACSLRLSMLKCNDSIY
jgi:hypothetical protein